MTRRPLAVALCVALGLAGSASTSDADTGPKTGPKAGPKADHIASGAAVSDLKLEADLEARIGVKKSMGRQVTDKLTLWSNEVGSHVNALTMDLVDLNFDMQMRKAKLRVGTISEDVGLRVDGNIKFRSNVARIRSSLALAVRGQTYRFELPVFEVTSQDVGGERSVEVRVPIIYGRF